MKPSLFLLLAALLGCVSGCTTVKVIAEPLSCPVPEPLLAHRCSEPVPLADGATYGALVKAGIDDRSALRDCARHDQALAEALRACNAAIDRYREDLREINRQVSAKS